MTPHLLTALVACFAMMETPNGVPSHPGPAGETGRWQLTPGVRYDRTIEILRQLQRLPTDEAIAIRHVLWIREQLRLHGNVNPSPAAIALAWNAGVHAAVTGHAPTRAHDYARRFAALVADALAAKP